jgi:hypothetical protein
MLSRDFYVLVALRISCLMSIPAVSQTRSWVTVNQRIDTKTRERCPLMKGEFPRKNDLQIEVWLKSLVLRVKHLGSRGTDF